MELLVFRHGIAADAKAGQADADRELTSEGVDKTKQAAAGLAALIDAPDVVLTSPKRRAVRTAELAVAAVGGQLETCEPLADGPVSAIVDAIEARRETRVMIVGHEPLLSRVIEVLCTGHTGPFIEMKKAGCACLDVSIAADARGASATLRWLMTPKALRAMA